MGSYASVGYRAISFLFSIAIFVYVISTLASAFWPGGDGDLARAMNAMRLDKQGTKLSDDEAAALERKLEEDEHAISPRRKLIAYYRVRSSDDEEAANAARRHTLWFVEHKPDLPSFMNLQSFEFLREFHHPEDYKRGEAMWLAHIEREPDNQTILENASWFFTRD